MTRQAGSGSLFTGGQGDDSAMPSARPADRVIAVSALNRSVAQLLTRSFPMVWIAGEISNFTRAASGHCYFSLKDASAQVRAVMFRSRLQALPVEPRNGQQVHALASVSLYEARGEFQLTVENLRLAGQGDLHQRFVALKERLQCEGLFDIEIKKPLPEFARSIGVITSMQAAALRDVLITLARRAPHIPIIIYPTPVQGDAAPPAIVRAVQTASRRAECDVLLLVRGGGSIEDLWAFNDEHVARAIRASSLPIVVGVGHESDITIADFAADMRAPTPTGAATLVVPAHADLLNRVGAGAQRLSRAWQRLAGNREQRLDTAQRLLPTPARQVQAQRLRVETAWRALSTQLSHQQQRRMTRLNAVSQRLRGPRLDAQQARVSYLQERLVSSMRAALRVSQERLTSSQAQLSLVSPQAVLARGYAVVRKPDGRVNGSVSGVTVGERLNILLSDGSLETTVEAIRPDSKPGNGS